ncbi:MAG: hypothetical protein N2439_08725, partial [Anaerolineae bacterium]|nr:hypothetical protein [Anaerolineae bacterium]
MAGSPDRPRQLPLDLVRGPGFSRDDLVVSASNQAAVGLIDRWPDWPASLVVIAGPPGAGKSHLASIWAAKAGAHAVDPAGEGAIAAAAPLGVNLLIDGIGGSPTDEHALFHAVNATRAAGRHMLLTSRLWPSQWNLVLPDLVS